MWWIDRARGALPAAALGLWAVGLAACTPLSATQPEVALTPTEQYSIQVEEAPDEVAFTVHPEGLSLTQKAALVALVDRWRQSPGASDLVVETPGGDQAAGAARTGGEVVAALTALGVPSDRIRTAAFEGKPEAPVVAWFNRLQARGPDCSEGWNNIAATGSNQPMTHFGCAVVANLAAQIADPRDLLAPAATAAPDAARRDEVLAKYRRGEITSTKRDEQAAGVVSRAVN